MIIIGLTGSIGMGKTTTARLFSQAGAPVFDADAAVHALYAPGQIGAIAIANAFGRDILATDGAVDRAALGALVRSDRDAFQRLEAIVHPLVAKDRRAFITKARRKGVGVVVLDIPLLFESGGQRRCDVVVVASAPIWMQRRRVLARPGMTRTSLEAILARQTPDAMKRAGADFVVETGFGVPSARRQVRQIMASLHAKS